MKLTDGSLGTLVTADGTRWGRDKIVIGMIKGITQNGSKEAIFIVQFQDCECDQPIHPDNLTLLT